MSLLFPIIYFGCLYILQSALPYPSCGYASRHNNIMAILMLFMQQLVLKVTCQQVPYQSLTLNLLLHEYMYKLFPSSCTCLFCFPDITLIPVYILTQTHAHTHGLYVSCCSAPPRVPPSAKSGGGRTLSSVTY